MTKDQKILGVAAALAVFASGCATTQDRQSFGQYIDSRTTGTKVKAALLADSEVSGLDVKVDTWKSNVQLNGFVDTPEQKQRAESIAWGVPGVREVQNNLAVKPRVETEDALGGAPRVESASSADAEVLFSRILANPSYHYGKAMALAGTVDTVFSPRAFTLESPDGVSNREVLVLADREVVEQVTPRDTLRVTGTLREFDRAAAEDRLGRRLADEEFEKWDGKPVLFLDSVGEWQPQGQD